MYLDHQFKMSSLFKKSGQKRVRPGQRRKHVSDSEEEDTEGESAVKKLVRKTSKNPFVQTSGMFSVTSI